MDSPGEAAAGPVGKDEIVKGYEHRKGEYVLIEPSELENLRVPSKHTIDVTQFIDVNELNPEYVEKPYFVTPENDGQAEAFAVVRRALQKTKKIAIGKIAFSGREHVVAICAVGDESRGGMMAYTLRYSSELRNQSDYFRDIKEVKIDEESLELAESLIAKRAAKLDMSKFEDGYEVAVRELVEAKVKHLPIPQDEPAPKSAKVINLMDALRKSVRNDDAPAKKSAPSKSAPAAKRGISLVKSAASKAHKSRKSA
jgi:DNA end-binding protein Ku